MIRHFLNPPNWFTSASIFCTTYALSTLIVAGASPDPKIITRACVLVAFGGVFDLLDGRVARMTNRFSEFGVQLDSIADIISFGVTPAMLVWSWKLHELGMFGAIITFWFVLCAAFRLARFNVNTINESWALKGHTQGLSSTMSGGALVSFAWMSNGYMSEWLSPSPTMVAIVTASFAFLMISSLPFRNFKDVRKNRVARFSLGISTSLMLAGAVFFDPSLLFGVGSALYMSWGIIDGVAVAIHFRRKGKRLDPDEEVDIADFIDDAFSDYSEEYPEDG